jgi:hypothetical protein
MMHRIVVYLKERRGRESSKELIQLCETVIVPLRLKTVNWETSK